MDDLEVKPMSTSSSIIHNKFNVKHIGALEEKGVKLGMDEGVKTQRSSGTQMYKMTTIWPYLVYSKCHFSSFDFNVTLIVKIWMEFAYMA
ncbi:hypothetical protein CFP56_037929 [Quercus suber]|uniref:Uncharacterized protein n=1 Tax=Quercus suber TaxID=58331 RepID=A0AAW0J328_QUESU